ncbi:MAG TPA: hypothetical protein PK539_02030 [Candidatus Paceibacterota bacterium]|nr:hypothetical protein [Candidatus Paceibacterota bacterium]
MDEEVFEKAKEEDLTQDEAQELQDFIEENGIDDVDEAFELWQGM